MHYHIFWGSKLANEPFILNFSDKTEAIDKFISLIKDVEGESVKDGPPPWKEKRIDDKTLVFQINTEQHRYVLVYCGYDCSNKEKAQSMNIN